MKLKQLLTMSTMLLALSSTVMAADEPKEKTLAFPGAEGYGRYVTGGRGGNVYRVTNLNDSGNGSLRWALAQNGPRTIVFGVSGTIHLTSGLSIPSNTTIAGQSAPGDGICIADYPCTIQGSNVIVRYMRFRLGNKNVKVNGADGWDGFGAMDQQDIIIDHCSVSWSIDECLSVLGNKNTTVQWCLVAQSLVAAGHTKGDHGYGGNWGGNHASFHHNLIAHHTSRTPRLGPRPSTQMEEHMDFRNNVIYNWGGNGCYGGEAMKVNMVNNYYKPGPGTPTDSKGMRVASIGIRTTQYITEYPSYAPAWHIWGKYFVDGNVNSKYSNVAKDNWTYGIYNQISTADNDNTYTAVTKDTMKINEPLAFIATTTHTADVAYQRVLDYAGASKSRDSFDSEMVSDARNGVATHTGGKSSSGKQLSAGFINSQEDNKPANAGSDWSAWPTLTQRGTISDYDGDGIDDDWEDRNNLDATDPSDAKKVNADGYTMLEVYLNSLVAAITTAQNADGELLGEKKYEEVADDGSESGKVKEAEGNVTWVFGNNVNEINVGSTLSPYVTASLEWGSTVSYNNKSRGLNNIRFAEVNHSVTKETTANEGNGIYYHITVPEGYYFRPTKIHFLASRLGTDGGKVDAVWHNANGDYSIVTGLNPNRNNATPPYSTIDEEVAIGSAPGTSTLSIHTYALDEGKLIALAQISVDGQVTKDDVTGISQTVAGTTATLWHSMQGTAVASPRKGLSIETIMLPDGTRQSRKVIIR